MLAADSLGLRAMVLFLHNRYRTTGGEERVVRGPDVARARAAGRGCRAARARLGRARPGRVRRWACCAAAASPRTWRARCASAVRAWSTPTTSQPALGWRALAAARAAGARVVLHLHQYRLVCAIGVCFTREAECTRCHGRNTLPGVRLNCRGSVARVARLRRRAGALAAAHGRAGRRSDRAEPLRARAAARAGRAAVAGTACTCWLRRCARWAAPHRRPRASVRLGAQARTRWSSRDCPRRRAWTWRSTPAGWRAMPLVVAGEGPELRALRERVARRRRSLRRARRRRRAGRPARRRGDRARAVALGRDLRAGGR